MTDTAVSVIVPVYNTSKYLKKCLDTLAAQTLEKIEIIVIDDGSTDGSGAICDTYADNSKFRIVHHPRQGVSAGRNDGLSCVSGEYCMFVDSDDWLEVDACESLYQYAKRTEADLIIGGYMNEATAGSTERFILLSDYVFEENEYKNDILVHTLGLVGKNLKNPAKLDKLTPVWSKLYRTQIIKDNNIAFINLEKLPSECLQFNFEFCIHAQRAAFLHKVVYHYRRNTADSVTKPYRDDLWMKWEWWIRYEKICLEKIAADESLWSAYYSRICCSIIPLGGNAVKQKQFGLVRSECKRFLSQAVYREAFQYTDFSACPIYWRVFFKSAEDQNIILFIFMTKVMRWMLKRRKE